MNVDLKAKATALAHELHKTREQQAATSDILRIISRSTSMQPVSMSSLRARPGFAVRNSATSRARQDKEF
jgi:hypothetical protein